MQVNTKMVYIENCISRIISSECVPAKAHQRVVDLAEALLVANNDSMEAAHIFLINLCNEAEAGKYAA
jgi:hypothetical protein